MRGSELFPISDYYRPNILDAITITRGGNWWTAVLLIKDPQTKKNKIILYKWQKKENGWAQRKSYGINSKAELNKILECLNEFGSKLF